MSRPVLFRKPLLGRLGSRSSDSEKLALVHGALRRRFPRVDRLAVALYDAQTGRAQTFLAHEAGRRSLALYEAPLRRASSLRRVSASKRVRVVNDLDVFRRGRREHTRRILAAGYRSSVTFPILAGRRLEGFVFLNSRRRGAFKPDDLALLEVFARLAADVATARVRSASLLASALRTAAGLVHVRDPETGNHLERMARYCRLIAQELARSGRYRLDDERIRYLEEFAPLHDVGKIGIPDRVLLKRARLTPAERRVMRAHTVKGREIVDEILRRFRGASRAQANALRQIAEHHHETMDGLGYPHGLRGREIALEARIAAVADVFDALTSARSYKDAWTVDRAFAALEELSRARLDRDCVRALLAHRSEVERIRRRFVDEGRLPLHREQLRFSGGAGRRGRSGTGSGARMRPSSRSATAGPWLGRRRGRGRAAARPGAASPRPSR